MAVGDNAAGGTEGMVAEALCGSTVEHEIPYETAAEARSAAVPGVGIAVGDGPGHAAPPEVGIAVGDGPGHVAALGDGVGPGVGLERAAAPGAEIATGTVTEADVALRDGSVAAAGPERVVAPEGEEVVEKTRPLPAPRGTNTGPRQRLASAAYT